MIRVFYPSSDVVHISVTTALAIIVAFCGVEGGTSSPRRGKEGAARLVKDEY